MRQFCQVSEKLKPIYEQYLSGRPSVSLEISRVQGFGADAAEKQI